VAAVFTRSREERNGKRHAQWNRTAGAAKGAGSEAALGLAGDRQEVVVDRVWGIRKLRLLVVSLGAAALLGGTLGWPANGAIVTSLDECRRAGGKESGKYCSGGALNGAVIREFDLAEIERQLWGEDGAGKACKKQHKKAGKAKRYSAAKCRS
jgi:hypothetical protein